VPYWRGVEDEALLTTLIDPPLSERLCEWKRPGLVSVEGRVDSLTDCWIKATLRGCKGV